VVGGRLCGRWRRKAKELATIVRYDIDRRYRVNTLVCSCRAGSLRSAAAACSQSISRVPLCDCCGTVVVLVPEMSSNAARRSGSRMRAPAPGKKSLALHGGSAGTRLGLGQGTDQGVGPGPHTSGSTVSPR